jgi:hypothetical protein
VVLLDPKLKDEYIVDENKDLNVEVGIKFEAVHCKMLSWLAESSARPLVRSCLAQSRIALMHAIARKWVEPGEYSFAKAPRSSAWGCDEALLSRYLSDAEQCRVTAVPAQNLSSAATSELATTIE